MAVHPAPRSSVAIVGAGTQGRRLAYMWSSRGSNVNIVDRQHQQLLDSIDFVNDLRHRLNPDSVDLPNIRTFGLEKLPTALADAWLVLECVPESLVLKRTIVSQLDQLAANDTIIASNSSSFTIADIIEGLPLINEARILSAHSYWPPETSVLEIMGHETTNPDCASLLFHEALLHGFQPFHVKRDSMGYIYNRIWAAIKREALLVAAEGVAAPNEIDAVFKEVLKTPKGPFEQMDVVGLDVVLDIEEHYIAKREELTDADSSRKATDFLRSFVKERNLGVKSGRGFYDYDAKSMEYPAKRQNSDSALRHGFNAQDLFQNGGIEYGAVRDDRNESRAPVANGFVENMVHNRSMIERISCE